MTNIFRSKKVVVLGAGVSGWGAARYLIKRGFDVVLSDLKPSTPPRDAPKGVDLLIGPQDENLLAQAHQFVMSPGVSPQSELYQMIKNSGRDIISEIDLALSEYSGKLVVVTGTNGKSTITKMMEHMLNELNFGKSLAGGNIGYSACDAADQNPDYLVLELSSYQLEQSLYHPADSAVFSSFSHDHLGRHKTLDSYFKAKWRVYHWLKLGADVFAPLSLKASVEEYLSDIRLEERSHIKYISPEHVNQPATEACGQEAVHNRLNAWLAYSALSSFVTGISEKRWFSALKNFDHLPYRFQKLGLRRGHFVVNDSKSTNVESVLIALASIPSPCCLLLGGQSKQESFAPVIDKYGEKISRIYCFGASGEEILGHLKSCNSSIPLESFRNLEDLLRILASRLSDFSGPVLFSPGCASFDEFANFEERGLFFSQFAKSIIGP